MSTIDLKALAKMMSELRGSIPAADCLDACIARDVRGIDPFAAEETAIESAANGDRLAMYVQMSYLAGIARVYPREGERILAKMSHLQDVASRLLVPDSASYDDSDKGLLAQAATASNDVGA